jgi:hypothetical protein
MHGTVNDLRVYVSRKLGSRLWAKELERAVIRLHLRG